LLEHGFNDTLHCSEYTTLLALPDSVKNYTDSKTKLQNRCFFRREINSENFPGSFRAGNKNEIHQNRGDWSMVSS